MLEPITDKNASFLFALGKINYSKVDLSHLTNKSLENICVQHWSIIYSDVASCIEPDTPGYDEFSDMCGDFLCDKGIKDSSRVREILEACKGRL